jgi:hypothetical protein
MTGDKHEEVFDLGFTITVAELLAFLRSKGYTIQTGRERYGVKAVRGSH